MNNRDFEQMTQSFLNNPQNKNKITNLLNSNDGKMLIDNLNQFANQNPNIKNALNSYQKGELNVNALSSMMATKDGQELARKLSKFLGN